MFIWIFVHLRNPINVRQIELLTIWLYSEWGEDRFVVVQHLWCRKICQIVCRVSRKWMESKFLDQDVDVVSLANKGIIIGCFVGRNYNKILMETGKLTWLCGKQFCSFSLLITLFFFSSRFLLHNCWWYPTKKSLESISFLSYSCQKVIPFFVFFEF